MRINGTDAYNEAVLSNGAACTDSMQPSGYSPAFNAHCTSQIYGAADKLQGSLFLAASFQVEDYCPLVADNAHWDPGPFSSKLLHQCALSKTGKVMDIASFHC